MHRQKREPVRGEARRRQRRNRRIWRNCVSVMACVVVFCVTYALIIPAITMEKEAFCGIEAHVHEESCYNSTAVTLVCDPAGEEGLPVLHTHDALCYEGETLICTLPELAGHVHTEACYETVTTEAHSHDETCKGLVRGALLCEISEDVGHTHDSTCYAVGEKLVCTEAVREGHTHSDDCYLAETMLSCTTAEGEGHAHSDACYQTEKVLTCVTAESEGHSHGESCKDAEGNLICTLPEAPAHTHGDGCYTENKTLICEIPEAPAHTHGEDCYTENKTLTCEIPEDPGHAHTDACYEQVLVCGQEEREGHAHTDACYEMVEGIVCGKEETEAATVTNLVCTLQQVAPHVHNESCSDENGNLICTIQNAVVHQHTEACLQIPETEENLICEIPVHEHTLSCFSNPQADVETAEDWTKTFAHVELTGNWGEDVLAIAKSQLGYNESTKNYIVEEDGETMKGYTRYGAWYGVPYGDWCAMYASFCYRYAAVEGVPLHCNCPAWINELTNLGLFHGEEDYIPNPGELIFFDWNADGSSDHVGIVVETDGDTLKTIEGNSGDTVGYHTYNLTDHTIQGYGALPVQEAEEVNPYLCGFEEHAHTEQCYDAEGNLTCGLEEHAHTEDCLGKKLFYTDNFVRAFVTIKGVTDLPEDLSVQVWEITAENDPAGFEALHEALTQQANDEESFVSQANYYGMELYSEDVPYELPETAEVSVEVEFIQPLFDAETVENGSGTKTYLLTPEAAVEEAAAETVSAEDGELTVETSVVSEEATFGAALLSLLSAEEEPQTDYQAEEIIQPVYEGEEEGLTAVSFQISRIATFAVVRTTESQTGTFWERVYTADQITSGGTYLIVSAEGSYALADNGNNNFRQVSFQMVKGNPGYYTLTGVEKDAQWTITQVGGGYRIQNQSSSDYLNMSSDNAILSSSSATLTITPATAAKCMRIATAPQNGYYLRNEGLVTSGTSGRFARRNTHDAEFKPYNKTTYIYNTRDMVIFKLSDKTSLEVPTGNYPGGGTIQGGTAQAPTKPNYGNFIVPTTGLTGETALVKNDVTVSGKYWSDPATSDLEKNFRKSSFAESAAIDGKVMSDKSVIYGDDDYNAFQSYAPNTFGVTLSALGQAYEVPFAYTVKTPVDLVYVLDVSGSMSDEYVVEEADYWWEDDVTTTRARELVTAVNTSMKKIMDAHPANRVGIVIYSSGSWEMLPLDRYTAANNQYLVYDNKSVSTSNGYSVNTDVIQGSTSLKNEAGTKSYANVGSNTTQGIGTYTQAGIAQAYKEFQKIGDDIYYTATVGEGEQQREITVKRQPVFVLLSDGEPTHSTSNYADVLNGPHYGDGTSSPTTSNNSTGNGKGIHGYNTVLSANYYKRMVSHQYQKDALFYTIGMGINETGDTALVSTSKTGDAYKRAVLNPNATTIAQYSSDASVTIDMLEKMILSQYTDAKSIVTSNNWPDSWYDAPHADLPVIQPNPYAGNYSYANQAYFGELGASELETIFSNILNLSSSESDYGFILYSNSSVTMHDAIGAGMEIKGDPILRYGGNNYAYTGKTTSGNVTTYVYDADFEDPHIPDYKKDLSKITVTVTKNADGTQTVKMVVPDMVLPIYMPEMIGEQFYYESLPVRLIYQVGLTSESEGKVLELEKTGGKLTFYTNKFGSGDISEQSRTVLLPSVENPFYQYDENNKRPYHAHHDMKVKRDEKGNVIMDGNNPVLDNRTQTLEFSTDCSDQSYNTETYQVIHTLGNNGKLVFQADPPKYVTIPVEKQWVSGAEEEITVTLYKVTKGDASAGTEDTWVAESVEELKLNAQNQWKGTFADKPIPTDDWYYAIGEAVPKNYAESYKARVNDEGEITFVNAQMESVLLKDSNPRQYLDLAKIDVTENDDGTLAVTDLVITNTFVPVVLPETGGPGTILYTTGGLLLMAASVLLLHNQSKKRRKGDHPSF